MPALERVPKVGDIVLFHLFETNGLKTMPAMVTAVHQPESPKSEVSLTLFYPGRAPMAGGYESVSHNEKPADGRWSWRPE